MALFGWAWREAGGAGRGVLAGAEQAADDVALDGDVAHDLHGGRQHDQAHEDREGRGRPALAPGQVVRVGRPARSRRSRRTRRRPRRPPRHWPRPARWAARRARGRCAPRRCARAGRSAAATPPRKSATSAAAGAAAPGQREPESRDEGAQRGGSEEAAEPGAAGVAHPLGNGDPASPVGRRGAGRTCGPLCGVVRALVDGAPLPILPAKVRDVPTMNDVREGKKVRHFGERAPAPVACAGSTRRCPAPTGIVPPGTEASPSPVYGARLLSGLRIKPLAGSNPAASAATVLAVGQPTSWPTVSSDIRRPRRPRHGAGGAFVCRFAGRVRMAPDDAGQVSERSTRRP